ncbi:MAG TPA: DNA repair protein RecO [Thermoanaerobaculia bacterium]|nr:DNA repair protein RecO [Thermoanaerobaculia bacterium]HUM29008.1 DNA repair protein RecO [Thermoanaerobaculia bacterium]HXK67436.1 DNA repair protein RecO [Thermoanaerobaculia bacterium]
MGLVRDQAIILATYPIGEKDLIVVLFTRFSGKRRGVARGARGRRSRLASAVTTLNEVTLTFYESEGRDLIQIRDMEVQHSSMPLASRLSCPMVLPFLTELSDRFFHEGLASERGFRLLGHVLSGLRGGNHEGITVLYSALWMLVIAGVFPSIQLCTSCGRATAAIDFEKMAFLCSSCADPNSFPVSPDVLDLVTTMLHAPIDSIALPQSGSTLRDMDRILAGCRSHYLGSELKTYRFLSTCDKLFSP